MNIGKTVQYAPSVLGIFCVLIGVTVLLGWVFHSSVLVQLRDHLTPMRFNGALCCVLGGFVLFFLNNNHRILSLSFSLLLFLLAGMTLSQYLFTVNLGIDELFFNSYLPHLDEYPGRMSPNAAIGFTLFALSSLVLGVQNTTQWIKVHIAAHFFIFSIGLVALLGYFFNITTHYGLGQWIKMAPLTAVGLMSLSLGLISYSTKKNYTLLIPFIVGFVLLNGTFLLWQYIKFNQESHLEDVLTTKIASICSRIEAYFDERVASFNRISYRWLSQEGGTPKSVWQADVNHYIQDQAGYVAIEWVDSHHIVRWVAPEQNNEQTIGFNLYQDARLRAEIDQALASKKVRLTEPLDLIQGGNGVLIFSPLIKQEQFLGFMVGVINTKRLFDIIVKKMDATDVQLTIKDKTGIIYKNFNEENFHYPGFEKKQTINLFGQAWEVRIRPSASLYQEIMSPIFPWITLLIGLIISVLCAVLIESFLSINRLQKKARSANERLQGIIEGSTDYIAAIDLNYNFIVFNTMYKNEVYRLFKIDLQPEMSFDLLLQKMTAENQQKAKKLWKRALEGKSFSTNQAFRDKLHDQLYYEIHYNPIYDADGVLIGASHFATNIYQRIKNERELRSYQQQLEENNTNLEKQNNNLRLLKELSHTLQANNSESQVIESIDHYIDKLLVGSSGIIYLLPDKEQVVRAVLEWGTVASKQKEFELDQCFALSRYQTYQVTDSSKNIPCQHAAHNTRTPNSYVCFPLLVQNKVLGLLYLELVEDQPGQVNTQLIQTAQMSADIIAINLYNIKLRETLQIQSTQDSLTGLYNRRFFEEFILNEVARSKRYDSKFTVFLLDIDNFKTINDTYGHQIGDKVLCDVSRIIRKEFRESDLIARWGGEEFIFIVRNISLDIAYSKADKLRRFIEDSKLKVNKEQLSLTVSIGISIYDGEVDPDILIKKADDALYQAKNTGRNKVIVNAYDQLNG